METIVAAPIENNDIEPFKMVKKLYSACMNTGNKNHLSNVGCKKTLNLFIELIEQRGLNISLDIFDRFGGWPVIKGDDWTEELWTWQKAVYDCRLNGYSVDYIVSLYVEADFKNSSRRIIYVRILTVYLTFDSSFGCRLINQISG